MFKSRLHAAGRPATASRAQQVLAGACIVMAAFNARTLFSSGAAILPEIVAALRMSKGSASAVTALPIACMGLCAPSAAVLGRRLGTERALLAGMTVLCFSFLVRSYGDLAALVAGTALAGGAIAVINVLLPVMIKHRFADRAALMTSLYTTAIGAGAASGAALTVPVERRLGGGWQLGLLIWILPALLAFGLLVLQNVVPVRREAAAPVSRRGLWRDPLALRMTLFFSLHSGLSYTVFGWLAPILESRGMDPAKAGYVVALTIAGQMVGTLVAPQIASKLSNQSLLNAMLALGSGLLLANVLFCPLPLLPWFGPLQGAFQGSMLAISMMLIVMRSDNAVIASRVSAMVQSSGMAAAAVTPFLVGLIHQWTGKFEPAALLFAAIGIAASLAGFGAGRAGRIVDQDPS